MPEDQNKNHVWPQSISRMLAWYPQSETQQAESCHASASQGWKFHTFGSLGHGCFPANSTSSPKIVVLKYSTHKENDGLQAGCSRWKGTSHARTSRTKWSWTQRLPPCNITGIRPTPMDGLLLVSPFLAKKYHGIFVLPRTNGLLLQVKEQNQKWKEKHQKPQMATWQLLLCPTHSLSYLHKTGQGNHPYSSCIPATSN